MIGTIRIYWYAAIICLLVFVGFFSFYHLVETPPTWYDEGINEQVSINQARFGFEKQLFQTAPGEFVSTPFVTTGYPVLLPIAVVFRTMGATLWNARVVMALYILLFASAALLFSSTLLGRGMGLVSLLILATFPPLYGQGKNVLGEVPGMFFLLVFLYAVLEIEKREYRGVLWYVLAGLFAGLCIATKPIFLLLGGAIIVAVLLYRKKIAFHPGPITLGVAACLVPLIVWLYLQFGATDTTSAVVGFYANPFNLSHLGSVVLSNAMRFIREPSVIFFALVEMVWMLSYFKRFIKNEKISLVETIAFVFSLLVLAAYFRTPGYYRYFFPAEILALIFLPYTLRDAVRRLHIPRHTVVTAVLLCGVVVLQLQQLLFGSWVAVHSQNTLSQDMAAYFSTLPRTTTFFVYDQPQVVLFLPDSNYYQYLGQVPDYVLGAKNIDSLTKGIPDILLIGSSDWNSLPSSITSRYKVSNTVGGVLVAPRI